MPIYPIVSASLSFLLFPCIILRKSMGICYGYIYLIFFQSVIQFDFAIGCEFDCIGQEIGDYLCEPFRIVPPDTPGMMFAMPIMIPFMIFPKNSMINLRFFYPYSRFRKRQNPAVPCQVFPLLFRLVRLYMIFVDLSIVFHHSDAFSNIFCTDFTVI